MNCKNCGAKLDVNSNVCPNCGTKLDDFDYVLLTADDRIPEIQNAPRQKKSRLVPVIAIILVIAILGGIGFVVAKKLTKVEKPALSFSTGCGVINNDEAVIYVLIEDSPNIQYIHGVSLYCYDKSDEGAIGEVISTDYQYTKNIDDSFRAIYFDADELLYEDNVNEFTYTFEMNFEFSNHREIFTYTKAITFGTNITGDVSDIVFDHSMETETSVQTTQTTTESETTTEHDLDLSYIYRSFWFTQPISNNDQKLITAIKFNNGTSCKITVYTKDGEAAWKVVTFNGSYEVKDGSIFVTDSEGLVNSYKIDDVNNLLEGLESRKYNSIKNAEDFFGV